MKKTCLSCRDLSEQIKKVTKDSHVRAEKTELMMSFQRGNVSVQQYKVAQLSTLMISNLSEIIKIRFLTLEHKCDRLRFLLQLLLCSLHEIYQALEEALDRNSSHPGVAPIYFPTELARLESIKKDLEFFYGQEWREKIVVPVATKRYCHRLRQVGFSQHRNIVAPAFHQKDDNIVLIPDW